MKKYINFIIDENDFENNEEKEYFENNELNLKKMLIDGYRNFYNSPKKTIKNFRKVTQRLDYIDVVKMINNYKSTKDKLQVQIIIGKCKNEKLANELNELLKLKIIEVETNDETNDEVETIDELFSYDNN